MNIINKTTQKIRDLYNIKLIIIVTLIEMISLPIQAMEEIHYFVVADKPRLEGHIPEDKKKAILTRSHKVGENPEPIQFISEKTKFQWRDKDVEFPLQHSLFLDKIHGLKKDHGDYNHLCLTLYAIYRDPNNPLGLKVVESPLFARTKEKRFSLDAEGFLQKTVTVKFYTKIPPNQEDRWAYFTTHNGGSSAVKSDLNIFPLSSRSYECGGECSVICKGLYPHGDDDKCQHSANACRHTEPNALYHIKKTPLNFLPPLL